MRGRLWGGKERILVVCGTAPERLQAVRALEDELPVQACVQESGGETCIYLGEARAGEIGLAWPNRDLKKALQQAILYVRARRALNG